ncbi:hypothetical protein H6770_05560 [Candidatus Peribacteria bacterium]|nr:hypothetical protein [Candidatus Peribacteria bacterium]
MNLSAQFLGKDAATAVGGSLSGVASGGFGDIAAQVALKALPFVNTIAVLVIVIAGMLAVVAQDENRIANARKVVAMSIVGIILINIAVRIKEAYIVAFNFDLGANPTGGATILSTEIFGVIKFLETPLVVIAITTIIVYGLKAVLDYNGEQGIQSFRKAVFSILMGILIITTKVILATAVTTGDPTGIIDPAVRTLFTIVGFVGLIAVVIIVIAGIYLIVNLADEGRAEKTKKIIISIATGLIFMLVISGLVAILINGIL